MEMPKTFSPNLEDAIACHIFTKGAAMVLANFANTVYEEIMEELDIRYADFPWNRGERGGENIVGQPCRDPKQLVDCDTGDEDGPFWTTARAMWQKYELLEPWDTDADPHCAMDYCHVQSNWAVSEAIQEWAEADPTVPDIFRDIDYNDTISHDAKHGLPIGATMEKMIGLLINIMPYYDIDLGKHPLLEKNAVDRLYPLITRQS